MTYKSLLCPIVALLLSLHLYSAVELYDYEESEEVLAEYEELFWENKFLLSEGKKLKITYYNDLNKKLKNRLLLSSKAETLDTYFNIKEQQTGKIFVDYHTSQWQLGFGSFRPTFGLGSSYYETRKQRFSPKVTSHSNRDLQGVFGSYHNDSYTLNLFHSTTKNNYKTNSEGENYLTYAADNESKYTQTGLIMAYSQDRIKVSMLSALLANEVRINQFHNEKSLLLLATNLGYKSDNLALNYELTYHRDEYDHAAKINFSQDDFSSVWTYKNLSEHSLNWINSGISNKYNSEAIVYSGENKFSLLDTDIQLGSTLKTLKNSNFWRTNIYCKLSYKKQLSYTLAQDKFRDAYDDDKCRYSHRIKARLFKFSDTTIDFTYSLHNKTYESGVANMYQLNVRHKFNWAAAKLNLKVLDNYKHEELVQDNENAVISTYYEFKEDALISGELKTKEMYRFSLRGMWTKSLYHKQADSVRIEVSYQL